MKKYLLVSVGMLFSLHISSANAIACFPSVDATTSFDTSNVTFRGSDSDACAGLYSGNDNATDLNSAFGSTWSLLAKDESPGSAGS
ncbi:MAG: hypothetical protein KC517_12405, partial [Bacteroidetes bacterium]|nr:hypothetical protein [Bacteroidota bacterium]